MEPEEEVPTGDCVYPGMGARSKIMLDALPGSCMLIQLVIIEAVMLVADVYRRKKKLPRNEALHLGRNNAIWNVVLIAYTQVPSTLIRLGDCRHCGFNVHDLPGGRVLRMYWAGSQICPDTFNLLEFIKKIFSNWFDKFIIGRTTKCILSCNVCWICCYSSFTYTTNASSCK